MDAWIPITIMAALAQTVRFMAQKQLKTAGLSTGGATFARFIYSAPLVAVLILIYAAISQQALPNVNGSFWAYALSGGLTQILATMCVVAIFSHRNFAVGITFKKSEVVMTAIASYLILGEGVGVIGAVAIVIGLIGVLIPDPTGLRYVFRAITPPGRPRRFDARFFLASADQLAVDPDDFGRASDELSHLQWIPLEEVRNFTLPFITEVVLAEIAAALPNLDAPNSVPFFDNRTDTSMFRRIDG